MVGILQFHPKITPERISKGQKSKKFPWGGDNVICILHSKAQVLGQVLERRFWVSRKGGTAEGGWGHLQGAVHMAGVQVLGLAVKAIWLVLGGPFLTLAA